jgi:hypothetical protein
VVLANETLRVDLVDFFRTRRTRGKPSITGDDFDLANRIAVPGSDRQNLLAEGLMFISHLVGARQKNCTRSSSEPESGLGFHAGLLAALE